MHSPYRRVSVLLPGEEFETLQAIAEREDRSVRQQATHLVRRSLATIEGPGMVPGGAEADPQRVAAASAAR